MECPDCRGELDMDSIESSQGFSYIACHDCGSCFRARSNRGRLYKKCKLERVDRPADAGGCKPLFDLFE